MSQTKMSIDHADALFIPKCSLIDNCFRKYISAASSTYGESSTSKGEGSQL